MQIEKYTDRLKILVRSAQSIALRSGHQQITPLHVFKALLDDEDRLAANLIEASGGAASAVSHAVEREIAKPPKVDGSGAGQLYLAPGTARLFHQAEQLSEQASDSFVMVNPCCWRSQLRGSSRTRWRRCCPAPLWPVQRCTAACRTGNW